MVVVVVVTAVAVVMVVSAVTVIVATVAVVVSAVTVVVSAVTVIVSAVVDATITAVVGLHAIRVREHRCTAVVVQLQHVLAAFVYVNAVVPKPSIGARACAGCTRETKFSVRKGGLFAHEDGPVVVRHVGVKRDVSLFGQGDETGCFGVQFGRRCSVGGRSCGQSGAVRERRTGGSGCSIDNSDGRVFSTIIRARGEGADHRDAQSNAKHDYDMPNITFAGH